MAWPISRRTLLQTTGIVAGAAWIPAQAVARPQVLKAHFGKMTGAQAIAECLALHGVGCVYGIPGAQENELWDEFKSRGVPYLLASHEFSAACMADGYARSTGKPGVLAIVPGPGITNALTGLGEALLDSVPIVAIVGDVANGDKYRPFQVHSLDSVALLKPVCKCVLPVTDVRQIPAAIQKAFAIAQSGEPGPVSIVIPYNLLIEVSEQRCLVPIEEGVPFDAAAFDQAFAMLADPKQRIGIYAGAGCMNAGESLARVAELLQAPVATSVSGKGVIPEDHPWSVGWGFGPHASTVAENAFAKDKLHPLKSGVTTLLAIGVKFNEVSTGFYGNPRPSKVIHVDANPNNLGKVMPADVCVHSDAGVFLNKLLECADRLRRPADRKASDRIRQDHCEAAKAAAKIPATKCGIDPLQLVLSLRQNMPADGMLFTDVTASEHLAAEYFKVGQPRTFFNPIDNQSMGWSMPAAIGAQRVWPGRTVVTFTGDGCFLMSAMELATAARECLPVKFFILDDRAYHYMQMLQHPAYRRTTATHLAKIDYRSFAAAVGVEYLEADHPHELDAVVRTAMGKNAPVLVRIATDYNSRKIRWIEAVRARFTKELTAAQKTRFLLRIASRESDFKPEAND